MVPLDQSLRTISKSDWNRPKGRREPSKYFDLFDGGRSWRHRNVIRTDDWRSKAVQRGERQVWSSLRGEEKRNIWTSQVQPKKSTKQDGESVDNFTTDLYCLEECCEFGTLWDDLIWDRIVVGIKDKKLSEKLQLDSKLTVEKAITKARQSETVKKQQPFLQETKSDPPPAHVDRLSKWKGKDPKEDMKKKKKPPKPKNGKTPEAQCSRCLGQPHPKRLCAVRESKCNKCSKVGHWAKISIGQESGWGEFSWETTIRIVFPRWTHWTICCPRKHKRFIES